MVLNSIIGIVLRIQSGVPVLVTGDLYRGLKHCIHGV
jgi:hypothetical protein